MKQLKLFNLAWPIFIETALFMLLGFVDVFVLSRYDDLAASAVGTANQAVSIVTIVFTVISGASAVLISQYLGAEKRENASRIAALSLTINFIFGIVISLGLVLFNRQILSFIGAKEQLLELSGQYLSIVGGFIFLQAVLSNASVIIRNHGLTKITMYVTVGMNIVNTGLDVLFVLGLLGFPKLGVTGVAIATTFSRIAGMIVIGIILFTKVEKPSIFKLLKPFPKGDLKDIFKIGIPSALETFLYNLSQLVITSLVLNFLTEAELITKTYVQNITMFFYLFAVAIAQASQIITGHLVGAKKTDEAYRRGFRSYSFALAIAAGICVIGVILRSQLMGIFTADEAVITMGANILLINTVLEFGRTTNLVLIACLRGSGDVYFPTFCAIFSNWLISVLGSYLLAVVFGMGIYGLWIALAADECIRGVVMILRWKSGKWKTKRVVKES
ncbi:MAG: MATE family efflux transporter [Ruminococcus sp.]|nr:MATE family efflux transporter [Ruminococcus sp.]